MEESYLEKIGFSKNYKFNYWFKTEPGLFRRIYETDQKVIVEERFYTHMDDPSSVIHIKMEDVPEIVNPPIEIDLNSIIF